MLDNPDMEVEITETQTDIETETTEELTWKMLSSEIQSGILSEKFITQHQEFILQQVRNNRAVFDEYNSQQDVKAGVSCLLDLLESANEGVKWPSIKTIVQNKIEKKSKNNAVTAIKKLHKDGPDQNAPLLFFVKTEKKSYQWGELFVTFNPFYTPSESKSKTNPGSGEDRQKIFLDALKKLLSSEETINTEISIHFKNQKRLPATLNNKFSGNIELKINENIGICKLGEREYKISDGTKVFINKEISGDKNSYITIFNNTNSFTLLKRYDNSQYQMNKAAEDVKNISTYFFPADNPLKYFDINCENEQISSLIKKYWVKYKTAVSFNTLPDQDVLSKLMTDEFNDGFLGGFLAFCIFEAILSDFEKENANNKDAKWIGNLPPVQSLTPPRSVDLKPFVMRNNLEAKNLQLSSFVINSAAVALNSGNHIILTGSPGTGKTTFAESLVEEAGCQYIICTASPDWTTNELLGRYMPAVCKDNQILEFQEGYFLQAIRNRKWLIIDELNRADIDSCMGALFSVLSGHETILPFRVKVVSDENSIELVDEANTMVGEDIKIESRFVGICHEKDYEKLCNQNDVFWYQVPESFRIICTMNDADAGMLNQLSFALQRRFSIVRLESPEKKQIQTIIKKRVEDEWAYYSTKGEKKLGRSMVCEKCKEQLMDLAQTLFAPTKNSFDFLSFHVIGIGQVVDIIRLTIEGISCSPEFNFETPNEEEIIGLLKSVLAGAVVMKILPQLSAYVHKQDDIENVFKPALKLLYDNFEGDEYLLKNERKSSKLKIDQTGKLLRDYLKSELKMHFRNSHLDVAVIWDNFGNSSQ